MNKLTVLLNGQEHTLLVANCALNLKDAYTVILGLDTVPLIELLSKENIKIKLVTSSGLLELRYGETGLYVKLHEWMEMADFIFYEGIVAPKIISKDDFYDKYINQTC